METIMRSCYEPDREETIDKILCNRCKHKGRGLPVMHSLTEFP